MADRLTQLQVCLDQLIEQFSATIHYVDQHHDSVNLPQNDPKIVDPDLTPDSEFDFKNTINELSSDILLKTRQILAIIDSLPGVGVSKKEQMSKIQSLSEELRATETQKQEKIVQKDDLLDWVNNLIMNLSESIANSRD
ncbi:BA75_01249T0 [Komagataella pastoris]|uniref:Mediator of RNA polymerase II transcription subunit 21 n=1 Tax=Komagataella pastoris TaxID=4922 RepID=A0A1B2J9L3_PICPA|nr:BA75_01249T0 [Komagataella pastoris]